MAKNLEITIVLAEEIGKSLTSLKPTHKKGTDVGSFADCKKQFAYAYCGGKEHYTAKTFAVGEFIFMNQYGHLLKDEKFPATLEEKPTSTKRGSSGISKEDAELFEQFLKFKEFMNSKK